jgi:hypothetical protein
MEEKGRKALPANCFSFETCGLVFGLFTSASGVVQLGGRGLLGETTLSEGWEIKLLISSVLGLYSRMSVWSDDIRERKIWLFDATVLDESRRGLASSIDSKAHLNRRNCMWEQA